LKVLIETKPVFTVIGKMDQGPSDSGPQWIKPLWGAVNTNFGEIRSLAKFDEQGNLVGLWGAMSDVDETFARWGAEGKYLAGCEAKDDAEAPEGWTKWVIPAATYAVACCTLETYGETFGYMLQEYLPQNGHSLVGAVHEFYPQDATERICLYFPIKQQLD
jgi:predicted transcriptional regulator YdeE